MLTLNQTPTLSRVAGHKLAPRSSPPRFRWAKMPTPATGFLHPSTQHPRRARFFRGVSISDAPCRLQTSPFRAWSVHPSCFADSSLLDLVGALFLAAFFVVLFHLCPMPYADTALDYVVGASLMATSFLSLLCPMPNTDTFSDNNVCASFMTARFDLRPMPNADSCTF